MEDLLSREIFSNVQLVVRDIITEGKCETVTGQNFYDRLLSRFGFFTGLLIRQHQELIVTEFDSLINGIRDTELEKLKKICSPDTVDNVNKLITLFLVGKGQLENSWKSYLTLSSRSKGGRRKTITCNRKKTKKKKRMKYK